ncbi:hypothetical protein [Brevibacterium sediminis]|uniref:LppX_LprAFG lipoprotein n=1 Tax=Brevibacterium sediminis TaxID=1857024 RepID=A0ABQ1N8M5_9MICO|nr:hypothetical protein [Brevibacterium sediminis]GGC51110.1 hypothetical protein GCM10010974_36510 [Brevibacterium sediminis]
MNKLTGLTVAAATALSLCACSNSDSAVDAHVTPVDSDAEATAMDRFETFKDDLRSIDSYHAQGTVKADDGTQSTDFVFDRQTDAFEGQASIKSGSVDLSIELVRASSLLWIKGPKEYWESFGYDATPAIGKYVVFKAAQGDSIAKTYDYDRLVSTVESIGVDEVTVEGEVEQDDLEYMRYRLGEEEKSTLLDVPATGEIDSAVLVSRAEGIDATITIDNFDTEVDISAPDPDDVAQAQGQ